ncbi:MAG: sugar O-acetyltransferase [Lachnospiraceae bacterium]|jgi:galactoside O-acetyltransferase|nr:sugar O-acetyltransferase [Lachnospiraceae bacterium]
MEIDEIFSRIHSGKLYFCNDDDLMRQQIAYLDKVYDFNHLKPSQSREKMELLREMFAEIGEGCYIETPFYANWGGKNVHFGSHIYANYNLVLVDDCEIFVDDHVMIGPNVVLCTATHPVEPNLRRKQAQYNLPVHIHENAWIGANCVIMPGVSIGENTVIGAGSVVTRDIPSNVVAYGNPCRVMREITEKDNKYYYRDREIDIE